MLSDQLDYRSGHLLSALGSLPALCRRARDAGTQSACRRRRQCVKTLSNTYFLPWLTHCVPVTYCSTYYNIHEIMIMLQLHIIIKPYRHPGGASQNSLTSWPGRVPPLTPECRWRCYRCCRSCIFMHTVFEIE